MSSKAMQYVENLKKTHTFHAPSSTPGVVSWRPKRLTKEQRDILEKKSDVPPPPPPGWKGIYPPRKK